MAGSEPLPRLAKSSHVAHAKMCLSGLPGSQVELDSSRMVIAFYCLGTLDLIGMLQEKSSAMERRDWRDWIWEQQTRGKYGSGFRPSPYMTPGADSLRVMQENGNEYNGPHLIMTYTALSLLAILRDDFSQLDRAGILELLRACQQEDGSFSALPEGGEADLRTVYCAFVISSMLDDWSGIDVDRSIAYIQRCSSYEGGYGQTPFGEALGGTTYCAIAALHLAPPTPSSPLARRIPPSMRMRTIRWLVQNQTPSGGFRGRTGKDADACYCFWCGAALKVLGVGELVDTNALAGFLGRCQFKFGGISKAPGERSDPYHTHLSLAALSVLPPATVEAGWQLPALDVLWIATEPTASWAHEHIPAPKISGLTTH
ncbi:terpenoid cyclases/Protein prenyltransferase [Amylocystis lapponica]|nr:terpenoid cyclases/Protein prenyltransferase [Amylocystis lapponica]